MEDRILLVDDNELCRDTLTQILKKEYVVEQASDEQQAMEFLLNNQQETAAVMVDVLGTATTDYALLGAIVMGPLHDIGKIAISDTILLKPGKLTQKEFDCMKSHTISGCEILENLKDAWSKEYSRISMEICRYHHERYDGKGYPDGLKGEEIPISAQIVAVADVYDALVHERVYKAAIPKDESYEMIMNGECGAFSPEMLQCLTNCRKKMEEL